MSITWNSTVSKVELPITRFEGDQPFEDRAPYTHVLMQPVGEPTRAFIREASEEFMDMKDWCVLTIGAQYDYDGNSIWIDNIGAYTMTFRQEEHAMLFLLRFKGAN